MNANAIFEKFLNNLTNARNMEEKEYAMLIAYDELEESGYTDGEKQAVWNLMLEVA